MSASIDDLASSLQDFFSRRFPLEGAGGPGSMVLVFDGLGTPLDPAEFVGSGTGAAQDLLSHQRAAALADQLPAGNALKDGWYLPRSGSRLSRWYEALVDGATSTATDDTDLTAFDMMRHDAARRMEENKLVVASGTAVGGDTGTVQAAGTHDNYYSTSMSPVDWFDPNAQCWTIYDVGAPGQTAPPPPQGRPRNFFRAAAFTIRKPDEEKISANPLLSNALREAVSASNVDQPVQAVAAPAFRRNLEMAVRPNLNLTTELAATPAAAFPFRVRRAAFARIDQMVDVAAATPVVEAQTISPAAIAPVHMFIDPTLLISATTPVPVTSDSFHVSFRYCLVRFDRPWWDDVFLGSSNWRVPGYAGGTLSSGQMSAPADPLTLITAGMLVIRDLKIAATWSDDDLKGLSQGVSLGPFSLAGASIPQAKNGTLEREGMQAIAWLCQVPPPLPPMAEAAASVAAQPAG